jgi:methionine--tRNA ligase beta chain
MEHITIDDFKKVEIKIGKIISAEKIEGSDKLLKLAVDFAEEMPRQVLSGIGKFFPEPETLVGKHCPFVTNLAPRPMMGLQSQAMILAAGDGEAFSLFEVPENIPPGTKVK